MGGQDIVMSVDATDLFVIIIKGADRNGIPINERSASGVG